mgnify:CR=1 FL=1
MAVGNPRLKNSYLLKTKFHPHNRTPKNQHSQASFRKFQNQQFLDREGYSRCSGGILNCKAGALTPELSARKTPTLFFQIFQHQGKLSLFAGGSVSVKDTLTDVFVDI